jgi:hypothetical protein
VPHHCLRATKKVIIVFFFSPKVNYLNLLQLWIILFILSLPEATRWYATPGQDPRDTGPALAPMPRPARDAASLYSFPQNKKLASIRALLEASRATIYHL